jgi:hypothetical protein
MNFSRFNSNAAKCNPKTNETTVKVTHAPIMMEDSRTVSLISRRLLFSLTSFRFGVFLFQPPDLVLQAMLLLENWQGRMI